MSEDLRQKKQLTHVQFSRAVDWIRKNKQQFLDQRPTKIEAAATLQAALGFTITQGSIDGIKEASGVLWESRRKGDPERFHAINAVGVLANALADLYRKVGEEVPASLNHLAEKMKAQGR